MIKRKRVMTYQLDGIRKRHIMNENYIFLDFKIYVKTFIHPDALWVSVSNIEYIDNDA
jgi:hypothetical protein